jgi:crotonobetainyl-CoA:carnitine CoA-transferase CaiB-like acyl-CoA transferase
MMAQAALQGLTVIDCSTLFAGPLAAMVLGDFGAEVIKVEHPARPDPSRGHGRTVDGIGLWWKVLGRNKRPITIDLSRAAGAALLIDLVKTADVLIENFRPGTLERWGIGPDQLHAANPGLIVARVTGFGQFGPYASRPGFGTLAESMSGFAAITGEPDGPPTLPPFGLADGVTALCCVNAVLMALRSRDAGGSGQVIDLAIIEPLLTLLGPQPTIYGLLGELQQRTGNRSVNNAPRNTYRTSDGTWVAVSTSSQSIAERVMTLVGHDEVIAEDWFATGTGRAEHADLLDGYVSEWTAKRPAAEVLGAFKDAQAAAAPIYDIRDVFNDPQYRALDSVTTVPDDDFGTLRMQNVLFRLSATPGSIRFTGRPHGSDTDTVLSERLGLGTERLAELRAAGAI